MTAALKGHVEPYEADLALRNCILNRSYNLLGRYQGVLFWHITMDDLRAFYGDAEIDSYYSFAFVRNPWEWLVSLFSFIRGQKEHPESMICGHMSFKQFLHFFLAKQVTQHTFFGAGGQPAVSRVFRLEDLPQALEEIASETGLTFDAFPRENVSAHQVYQDYYDVEDRKLVQDAFAQDIMLGRYEYEPRPRSRKAGKQGYRRFILDGPPRSGTTALMAAISMHPECFCANERYQIFADHQLCLTPDTLGNEEVPPAFTEERGIVSVNLSAFSAKPIDDPNSAFAYLANRDVCAHLSQRPLKVFGNKTPRYSFNALDICTNSDVNLIALSRSPTEICTSWNARAADGNDAWLPDEVGLLGMMEYIQFCHVLANAPRQKTFVAVYDQLFFEGWREGITKLLEFLGVETDDRYLRNFDCYFVRSRKKTRQPNEGEKRFCAVSGIGAVHEFLVRQGSERLSSFGDHLQQFSQEIYDRLDTIVQTYFESCFFYARPEAIIARILKDQSLLFARARFQSVLDPLRTRADWPHLNAWLSIALFRRRAFAASKYFDTALDQTDFSDVVRTGFAAASVDKPYIYDLLENKGLATIFAAGMREAEIEPIHEAAQQLWIAGLREDAQILRMRAIGLAGSDGARANTAALAFAAGEAEARARLDIGLGTWGSWLDMNRLTEGFA